MAPIEGTMSDTLQGSAPAVKSAIGRKEAREDAIEWVSMKDGADGGGTGTTVAAIGQPKAGPAEMR